MKNETMKNETMKNGFARYHGIAQAIANECENREPNDVIGDGEILHYALDNGLHAYQYDGGWYRITMEGKLSGVLPEVFLLDDYNIVELFAQKGQDDEAFGRIIRYANKEMDFGDVEQFFGGTKDIVRLPSIFHPEKQEPIDVEKECFSADIEEAIREALAKIGRNDIPPEAADLFKRIVELKQALDEYEREMMKNEGENEHTVAEVGEGVEKVSGGEFGEALATITGKRNEIGTHSLE